MIEGAEQVGRDVLIKCATLSLGSRIYLQQPRGQCAQCRLKHLVCEFEEASSSRRFGWAPVMESVNYAQMTQRL